MTRFDMMARRFDDRVLFASRWRANYYGAAHVTRLRQAIKELRETCAEIESILDQDEVPRP